MGVPSINDVKELATKCRSKALVVIAFTEGKYGVISYGMTRNLCRGAAKVTDQVFQELEDGSIDIPDELLGTHQTV